MGFEIFMIICNLLIPIIMLFFGVKFAKRGPKEINGIYGYRTSMSMKNKETWEFAHQYCGILWKRTGFILLIMSVIVSMVASKFNDDSKAIIILILITIQTVVLIGSIFPVEKELKKNFDKNGKVFNLYGLDFQCCACYIYTHKKEIIACVRKTRRLF